MSMPRGVSLCGLKNEPLSRWIDKVRQGDTGDAATRVTTNVELVKLGPDASISVWSN